MYTDHVVSRTCFTVGQGCKQRAHDRVPGALPVGALCFLLRADKRLPCMQDIYADGPSDDVGHLQLLTSPLAATDEVLNLFNSGLVPVEIAMPSVLHAIGATKEDIDAALEKAKQKEDEARQDETGLKDHANKDSAITLEIKQVELAQKKKELQAPAAATSAAGGGSSSAGKSSD